MVLVSLADTLGSNGCEDEVNVPKDGGVGKEGEPVVEASAVVQGGSGGLARVSSNWRVRMLQRSRRLQAL